MKQSLSILDDHVVRVVCHREPVGATFAIRNPDAFRPLKSKRVGDWRVATAGAFSIRFKDDGVAFSEDNLEVRWSCGGTERVWRPGMTDDENLGGSYLSLDLVGGGLLSEEHRPYDPMEGFDSHNTSVYKLADTLKEHVRKKLKDPEDEKTWWAEFVRLTSGEPPTVFRKWPKQVEALWARVKQVPPGLLSRSGATIFRDDSLPWDPVEEWVLPRPDDQAQILYLVHYDHDYKAGLQRLTSLLGPVPRPEDWVLGVWFSCYRKMGEKEFRRLYEDFKKHDLPLDAVVIDTDWHREFWHGFDYNNKLFPDPKRFAKWMRKSGLHGVYNVHPCFLHSKDSKLPEFLTEAGVEKKVLTKETAPTWFQENCHKVDLFDRKQARLYFDIFHKPIERDGGCDMWWIDGTLKDNTGRDATSWINDLYATEARPRDPDSKRDRIVLSRTHGLGAHRSTLHFTGDTFSQWKVLEAEVRLTPIAGNSLLAYVSHDIGGFFKGSPENIKNKPADDLMVRWAQFGCLGPIMRFHSDHGIREPWRFTKGSLTIMRDFLKLRKSWGRFLASLADEAHATGISLCRPMYYEFPAEENAYIHRHQYMLGPDILVSPVTSEDRRKRTWFPPGRWRHLFLDRVVEGPCAIDETVPIEISPVYTRADRFPHES